MMRLKDCEKTFKVLSKESELLTSVLDKTRWRNCTFKKSEIEAAKVSILRLLDIQQEMRTLHNILLTHYAKEIYKISFSGSDDERLVLRRSSDAAKNICDFFEYSKYCFKDRKELQDFRKDNLGGCQLCYDIRSTLYDLQNKIRYSVEILISRPERRVKAWTSSEKHSVQLLYEISKIIDDIDGWDSKSDTDFYNLFSRKRQAEKIARDVSFDIEQLEKWIRGYTPSESKSPAVVSLKKHVKEDIRKRRQVLDLAEEAAKIIRAKLIKFG